MNTLVFGHPGTPWGQKKIVAGKVYQKYLFGGMELFNFCPCFWLHISHLFMIVVRFQIYAKTNIECKQKRVF